MSFTQECAEDDTLKTLLWFSFNPHGDKSYFYVHFTEVKSEAQVQWLY
jgi:hypothetical protein